MNRSGPSRCLLPATAVLALLAASAHAGAAGLVASATSPTVYRSSPSSSTTSTTSTISREASADAPLASTTDPATAQGEWSATADTAEAAEADTGSSSGAGDAATATALAPEPDPLDAALAADILANPAYSPATKEILLDQLASDYADFEVLGGLEAGMVSHGPLTRTRRATAGLVATPPLRLTAVRLDSPYSGNEQVQQCGPLAPCPLPLDYDVPVLQVVLEWSFADTDVAEAFWMYFLQGPGETRIVLRLDGRELAEADEGTPGSWQLAGDDYTLRVTGMDCAPNASFGTCLQVVIPQHEWFPGPPPWPDWKIEVEVWEEQAVDSLRLAFDRFGNPVVVRSELVLRSTSTGLVAPKPSLKSYFAATLGKTIQSDRCTSCHALDSPTAIADQHRGFPVYEGDVVLVPSIVTPGASIFSCQNCHDGLIPDHFAETRWATPPASMGIDWGRIIDEHPETWAREVCDRIVTNLPSHAARVEHFHEDGRLFWAVEDGRVPFGSPLERALPQDYDLFIERFDVWNDAGARCPD